MKSRVLLFSLLMIGFTVSAQVAVTQMKLTDKEHDFGTFKEEAGRQTFDFVITNTGTQPLIIQNVVASCGCTTPEWTKQPIPAGGKGKVTAIYDPKDRPGAFNKTLTVYTNTQPENTVLVIKGEVTPHEKTIEELYTFQVGAVRFENQQLPFTIVKKNEKKIRVMKIINTSAAPVKVEFDGLPAHLTLKVNPETLKPNQTGLVEGTYDATKNPAWGNVNDMVKVKLNGVPQESLLYYVSANLVEDFSAMTKTEMDNAPVFKVASATIDLGKIKGATQKEVEWKFTNAGKNDLIIRNIKSTCGCTVADQSIQGVGIKAGTSSSIKAIFDSGGNNGKVSKYIYVYTNDPKYSEVTLSLSAEVEQPQAAK